MNKQRIIHFFVDIEFLFSCSTRYLTSESSEQERYRLTPIDRAVRKASDASKLIILIYTCVVTAFVKAGNSRRYRSLYDKMYFSSSIL